MDHFYQFSARKLGEEEEVPMSDYEGKMVLVVNTASLWGATVRDFTQMNELCEKVIIEIFSYKETIGLLKKKDSKKNN